MANPDPWAEFNPQPAGGGPVGAMTLERLPEKPAAPREPKTTYQTLTPEEATRRKLPAGQTYQVSSEGKLDTIPVPKADAAGAASVDPKTMEGQRNIARNVLTAAGVKGGDDPVAKLIGQSTSGALQKFGADAYGAVTGDATSGMEAIGRLQTIGNDMVLQMTGGSLGTQISNADRDFIAARMGDIGNPEKPASQRAAAWDQVRSRLAAMAGDDSNPPTTGETETPVTMATFRVKSGGQEKTFEAPENTSDEEVERLSREAVGDTKGLPVVIYRTDNSGGNPPGGPSAPSAGPPAPPSGPGIGSQLLDATQNTVSGLAQGAAGLFDLPMLAGNAVERGTNYALGKGGGAVLDLLGLDNAADWWRQGSDRSEASLANMPTASGAIEQLSPTPPGGETARFLSQLVGGAMVPFGPKSVPRPKAPIPGPAPANEIIAEGARNGVRVMTSDIRPPSTFTGKTARAMGERIPYAGTGGPRAAQQGERVQAVKDLAQEYGVDPAMIDQVAADLGATRGARITSLKGRKDKVIDGTGGTLTQADVASTLQAIGAETHRLAGIDATEYAPVIDRLTRFGENIASGKSLRQIEGNRKLLGEMFEGDSLATLKSEGQKSINAIYKPLRDDMGAFIETKAGAGARSQWARANDELSAMAGELDDTVFRNVLKSNDTTPENVSRLLFSKKPSEVTRLMTNLSPDGKAKAQAAVIGKLIDDSGGMENISPDRFANAVGRLGRSTGVVFEGADLARIKGLERLLQATKQAGVASAAPPTGVQNTPIIGGYAAGTMFGPGAIPFLGSAGLLARAYESAPMRNLLAGLGMSKPGTPNESRLIERIVKAATSQTSISRPAVNDALAASPGRMAASTEQENN